MAATDVVIDAIDRVPHSLYARSEIKQYGPNAHASHTLQELKALRETREGLDDQIERLQWSLAHDYREPCSPTSPQASSDEGDAEEDAEEGEYDAAMLQVGWHSLS